MCRQSAACGPDSRCFQNSKVSCTVVAVPRFAVTVDTDVGLRWPGDARGSVFTGTIKKQHLENEKTRSEPCFAVEALKEARVLISKLAYLNACAYKHKHFKQQHAQLTSTLN